MPDKYQVRTGTKKFRMKEKNINSSLCDDKIRLSSNLAVVLIMRQNEMLCHRECKTKNAYGLVVLILDDEILNMPSYVHHTIPKAGAHILSKLSSGRA